MTAPWSAFRFARFMALVMAVGLWLGPAGSACAQPSLWVVHGANCTITLFGSVHVLPAGLDWEPPALAQALSRADELWFEIPVEPGSQARVAAEAQRRGFLPPEQSLSNLMSADGAHRLAAFAALHNLSLDKLNRMQPWFADLLVSSFAYVNSGGAPQEGVEEQLAQVAPQAQREAFETIGQQLDMIAGAPLAAQIASLESSLKEAGEDPHEYDRLVSAWMKGDGQAIYRHDVLALRDESPVLFQRLVTQRNAAWTRALAERLKGSGEVVVVVGAAHLLGPDGVPARLRALGLRVDGPAD